MTEPISEKDLKNLKEQLDNVFGDKDRIRIINNAIRSHSFTCDQVAELVKVQRFGEGRTQTAILMYPVVQDKENFEKKVISLFKYDDEKASIRQACKL